MTEAQFKAALAAKDAELAALKQQAASRIQVKFSPKGTGAIMVTGIGQFPATFYASQWDAILSVADQIRALIPQAPARVYRQSQAVG